ncbi:MAG TPA: hypothetical protein VK138_04560 [Acidiferrobacterales bacterium]|nr:hypothetical protein [Acidiferrobacterales bacterium]
MARDQRSHYPHRMLAVAICLLSLSVLAEEESSQKKDSLLGWTITPGVGVRVLDLHVKRGSDGATGTITNDGSFTGPMYAALNVESPTLLLNEKVGVTVRGYATSFSLGNQRVKSTSAQGGEDIKDLGTSVTGYYSYVMPTIFYRSVDRTGDSRFGVGYGYWKTWFSGDIILAQDNAATATMAKTSISGSTDGKSGVLLFWQGRWPRGLFEIAINNVRFATNNYKYEMHEINMLIGYHFEF